MSTLLHHCSHKSLLSQSIHLRPSHSSCCILRHVQHSYHLPPLNTRKLHQKSNLHLGLKRSMDQQETFGLENLGLEKPQPPRKGRRANKRKDGHTETKAEFRTCLPPGLQQASGQHASDISSCDLAVVPPYQPLPIVSPSKSADNPIRWPSQTHSHWFGQDPPGAPINHSVQNSVFTLGPPNVSKPGQGLTIIKGPSTLPSATAVPLVQPRLPSRGPKPTVQKSSLSVSTFHSCIKPVLTSRIGTQKPPHRSPKLLPKEDGQVHRQQPLGRLYLNRAMLPESQKP